MDGIDLNAILDMHKSKTESEAKERFTTSLAAAVMGIVSLAERTSAEYPNEVDGANAASDTLDTLSEGLKRHTLTLPKAAQLPAGSSSASQPTDPQVEELRRQVAELRQEAGDNETELERVTNENKELRSKLREERANNSNLQSHVDEANSAKEKAEGELKKFREKIAGLLGLPPTSSVDDIHEDLKAVTGRFIELLNELERQSGIRIERNEAPADYVGRVTTTLKTHSAPTNQPTQPSNPTSRPVRRRATAPATTTLSAQPTTAPAAPVQPSTSPEPSSEDESHPLDEVGRPEMSRRERRNGRPPADDTPTQKTSRIGRMIPGHRKPEGSN